MDLATQLSIAAGLVNLGGFITYNKQIFLGQSKPNVVTWLSVASLSVLICLTYIYMSDDLIKSIMIIVAATAAVVTFLLSLFLGKLSKPNIYDAVVLITVIIIGIAWWVNQNATIANLVLQGCLLVSFIPTFIGVWQNPKNERITSWLVWNASAAMHIVVVVLRWQGQYQDLAHPICLLVLNTVVIFGTLRKK